MENKENLQIQEEMLSGLINTDKRTYTFNKTYEFFGQKLQGTFVAKYMSISDRLKLGVIRGKLLDGVNPASLDTLSDDIIYMIAYLKVSLVEQPKWWNYDFMTMEDDYEKLREVYMEVYEFNKCFRGYYDKNANAGFGADSASKETLENL